MEYLLSQSKEANEKLSLWSSWHNQLARLQTNFSQILPLVNEAAKLNGTFFLLTIQLFRV